MPRAPRITPAGVVFHVLNRAVVGLDLFAKSSDYLDFHRLLLEAGRRFEVRVCAYCLMPNHWHLVLWPLKDGAVSAYIHWLATKHSLHYRLLTATTGRGHVYQSRFQSFPVQTGRYYYNVVRYVESNPVAAGLVTRAEDWQWSSLTERLHGCQLIVPGPLDLPGDWTDLVNAPLVTRECQALDCCERSGRPYGAKAWVARAAARHCLQQTLHGRGRPSLVRSTKRD